MRLPLFFVLATEYDPPLLLLLCLATFEFHYQCIAQRELPYSFGSGWHGTHGPSMAPEASCACHSGYQFTGVVCLFSAYLLAASSAGNVYHLEHLCVGNTSGAALAAAAAAWRQQQKQKQ